MVERVVVGPWKTNCYIYSSAKKECIIIDPGGSEAEIAARVDVLNMVPVGIALTHGHVDHVAALAKLRAGYASRGYPLPIAIHPADRKFLGTGGRETHRESLEVLGLDELNFFGVDPAELPKADVRLKDGDHVFNMDIIVLETPGHTPGSVCFYSEKEGILFSGDTLFFDGVGRTDLPGGSEKKLRESIQKKLGILPPETRVFPGHGMFTSIERERRGNILFRDTVPEPRPVVPRVTLVAVAKGVLPASAPGVRAAALTKGAPKKTLAKKSAVKKGAVKKTLAKKGAGKGVAKKKVAAKKSSKPPAARKPAKVQATRSTKAPGGGKKPAR
jgi:hydroxyacylglutathione hydrolase